MNKIWEIISIKCNNNFALPRIVALWNCVCHYGSLAERCFAAVTQEKAPPAGQVGVKKSEQVNPTSLDLNFVVKQVGRSREEAGWLAEIHQPSDLSIISPVTCQS